MMKLLIIDVAMLVSLTPLPIDEYVSILSYVEPAEVEPNNEARDAVNADNNVNTPPTPQRIKAAIEAKYTAKFGATYDSSMQVVYPIKTPPKNTAKSTVSMV